MTGAEILAIPLEEPERLFSGPAAARGEFHELSKIWHVDVNPSPDAVAVFGHLTALWARARTKIQKGEWQEPGVLTLHGEDGKDHRFEYFRKGPFELGEFYAGPKSIVYAVRPDAKDLLENALAVTQGFQFASLGMREECARYLPPPLSIRARTPERLYLAWQKNDDLIALRDLLAHCGGAVDPKHVAWIISSLLNVACYLRFAGLVHQAIDLDAYWVSPEFHSGVLLGGWWYAAKAGERIVALPSASFRRLPPDVRASKRADPRLDLNLIRATALELLGDPKKAPEPMRNWLRCASAGNAIEDYRAWRGVLEQSFGPRKFVELNVSAKDVYRK